jgi:hypothetical protein
MHYIRRMLPIKCKAGASFALPFGRFGVPKRNFFYQKVLQGARISLEKLFIASFQKGFATFGTTPELPPAILTGKIVIPAQAGIHLGSPAASGRGSS